jgi:hypothetical protein
MFVIRSLKTELDADGFKGINVKGPYTLKISTLKAVASKMNREKSNNEKTFLFLILSIYIYKNRG